MIDARSSVKLLRRAGLVLIALPEAVTTPVGVACLLTARYLSKKIEADLYKRLYETIKHYLAHSKRPAAAPETKLEEKKQVKRAHRNADRLIPKQAEVKIAVPIAKSSTRRGERLIPAQGKNNIKASRTPSAIQKQIDTEAGAAVHHSIDMKWLSRRYETNQMTKTSSARQEAAPDEDENLILHTIDRQKIARRFDIESSQTADAGLAAKSKKTVRTVKARALPEKPEIEEAESTANHHKIDVASLRRRYGTTALR